MKTMTTDLPKRDLDAVIAYLETGLTLSFWAGRSQSTLRAGDVTRERAANGHIRTTHLSDDLRGYVWLTRDGIKGLAATARQQWPDRDRLIAERGARVASLVS